MNECFICGTELPPGRLFEEVGGKPVCMDCWRLFFADDGDEAEPPAEVVSLLISEVQP